VSVEYSELSDSDLLVLVGVSRVLINIDDLVSLEEVSWVRTLITQINQERWRDLVEQSRHEFHNTDELVSALERVADASVRAFILDEAHALAGLDGLVPPETDLLKRLETARGGQQPST